MRSHEIDYVLFFLLFSCLLILAGCASTDKVMDQVTEVAPLQIPLERIADMPIPSRTVTADEAKTVFLQGYMTTLYDRHQRIDKEQTPCHEDQWYSVCAQKGKIVVTKKKTGQIAKTVETGEVDFIGDLNKGDGFFTVLYAQGVLHVLFQKIEVDAAKGVSKTKIVKRSYPLSGLEFKDQKVSVVIKDQTAPGYGLWLCTIEKEEPKTPLYEIEFVGSGDKTPFIKKLVAQE